MHRGMQKEGMHLTLSLELRTALICWCSSRLTRVQTFSMLLILALQGSFWVRTWLDSYEWVIPTYKYVNLLVFSS